MKKNLGWTSCFHTRDDLPRAHWDETEFMNKQCFACISAVPLHWVYKTDKLDSIVEGAQDVGFWELSQCPFYTLPCGTLSGYADQSFVVLKSLVDNKGMNCNWELKFDFLTFSGW